jgi:hypothetical protein
MSTPLIPVPTRAILCGVEAEGFHPPPTDVAKANEPACLMNVLLCMRGSFHAEFNHILSESDCI